MLTLKCLVVGCKERAMDTDKDVVVALYNAHIYTHTADTGRDQGSSRRKSRMLDRPNIAQGSSMELWDSFRILWRLYKGMADLPEAECSLQLLLCCSKELREQLFRTDPKITAKPEEEQIESIRKLAVVSCATVGRSGSLSRVQEVGEQLRGPFAKEQTRKCRQNTAESAAKVPPEASPKGRQKRQSAKMPKCQTAVRVPPLCRQNATREPEYVSNRCRKERESFDPTRETEASDRVPAERNYLTEAAAGEERTLADTEDKETATHIETPGDVLGYDPFKVNLWADAVTPIEEKKMLREQKRCRGRTARVSQNVRGQVGQLSERRPCKEG